jgi:hypothetical protein
LLDVFFADAVLAGRAVNLHRPNRNTKCRALATRALTGRARLLRTSRRNAYLMSRGGRRTAQQTRDLKWWAILGSNQ